MASLFSRIVQGEIPAHKILEDEKHLAFLDISPLREGHTLVIPKREVDYIFNLTENELSDLMIFAQKVARKIEKAIACNRIGVCVIGLEVPHAHIHLVPIDHVGDINFSATKLSPTPQELEHTARKIQGV